MVKTVSFYGKTLTCTRIETSDRVQRYNLHLAPVIAQPEVVL